MANGEHGLEYWMRWQVLVCALILATPAAAAAAVISRWRRDPLRAVDLWIPCWRNMHPLWLLIYRALVFLFMSWLLFQMVLYDGASAFYFYTQWTFTLVITYFAIATLISAHGCWIYSKRFTENEETEGLLKRVPEENIPATLAFRTNRNNETIKLQSQYELEEDEKSAGLSGCLMQVVYQTSAGATVLTDVIFWGLLVPFMSSPHFKVNLVMGCMHSLNAAFLLLDTALNSLPFPSLGMAYFVLLSCIYVAFQWVLHACGLSWWPYPFLELANPWAPLWYFSMALVHIPCFGLYYLIAKAKNSCFSKFFPRAYARSF